MTQHGHAPIPDASQPVNLAGPSRIALIVGAVGFVLFLIGWFVNVTTFYQAYLMAFFFWLNMSLGCLALIMIQHLSGGRWGMTIRRAAEAGIRTLPMMAALFVPLALFGVYRLYEWADPALVASDHVVQHKAPWLNVAGWQIRAVIYFALWIGAGTLLVRASRRQDATGDPNVRRTYARVSAVGGILYFFSMTLASVDWGMSLDVHWFSTMYGVIFIIGQALGAMALLLFTLILLSRYEPLKTLFRVDAMHDLGKLMLAFTMLWAYVSFSQYLIVYSANLKEEIPYYIRRGHGGWEFLSVALIALNFFLPFVVLLSRTVKRTRSLLLWVAALVVALRFLDIFWTLAPSMRGDSMAAAISWMDFAGMIAIGGLWVALFLRNLSTTALLPFRDPKFEEAIVHGGH